MSTARRIEIAGVAGAGKSTLARVLCERHGGFRIADSLHTRLPAHWPYVAHSIPGLLPLLARAARHRPALSWDEVKLIVYVSEWDRYLGSRRERRTGVIILDQGPLFALARLLWGRKPVTREDAFRSWVDETLVRWSSALDAIVWLVAPDDALLERIDWRDKQHEAKGAFREDALELIASHRQAYRQLLQTIDRVGELRVLPYDTGTMRATEIADELGEIFGETESHRLTDAP